MYWVKKSRFLHIFVTAKEWFWSKVLWLQTTLLLFFNQTDQTFPRSNTVPDPAHVSPNNKCSQYGHLSSRSLGGTLQHCPPATSKDPSMPSTTDRQAKRLPDGNKSSSAFTIKEDKALLWSAPCHVSCWMTWRGLCWLFWCAVGHFFVQGCGDLGMCLTTMLRLYLSKSSVKTDRWVICCLGIPLKK